MHTMRDINLACSLHGNHTHTQTHTKEKILAPAFTPIFHFIFPTWKSYRLSDHTLNPKKEEHSPSQGLSSSREPLGKKWSQNSTDLRETEWLSTGCDAGLCCFPLAGCTILALVVCTSWGTLGFIVAFLLFTSPSVPKLRLFEKLRFTQTARKKNTEQSIRSQNRHSICHTRKKKKKGP